MTDPGASEQHTVRAASERVSSSALIVATGRRRALTVCGS